MPADRPILNLDYAAREASRPRSPRIVAIAVLVPTLVQIPYLLLSRAHPGQHSGLLDWIVLLAATSAGVVVLWAKQQLRRRRFVFLSLYILLEMSWLFAAGLLIASHLEMP